MAQTLEEEEQRFTPACVGTMNAVQVGVALRPVHPRVRGDDGTTTITTAAQSGSPPRAWGR